MLAIGILVNEWASSSGFKPAFHDTDADILATILARMSVSWNAGFTRLTTNPPCVCVVYSLHRVECKVPKFDSDV